MKKYLSIILALSMTMALLCNPAMAARVGSDSPNQSATMDVNIKLNPGNVNHKYCIDIEFGALEFTFSEGDKTWDPEDYKYDEGTGGGWSGNGAIKIINHSDLAVKYNISAQKVVDTYGDLTVTISGSTGTIGGCTPSTAVGSKNASATVGISGTPSAALSTSAVKLGEVKVVISNP